MTLPLFKRACALAAIIGCFFSMALALMRKMELPDIWRSSQTAVHGTVAELVSKWVNDGAGRHIHTFVTLHVIQGVDSCQSGSEIVVDTLGGTVGDLTEWVEDEPVFTDGEEVVLFLSGQSEGGGGAHRVTGLGQGKYTVEGGNICLGDQSVTVHQLFETLWQAKRGDVLAWQILDKMSRGGSENGMMGAKQPNTRTEHLAVSSITSITPDIASAGTGANVTIQGSGFEATQGTGKVEFFYRTGQNKITAPIVSWSDTQVVCTVPIGDVSGYAASSSSGPVTVTPSSGAGDASTYNNFRVTFGYGGQKWPGTNPLVNYYIGSSTIAGWADAIHGAAGTWNAAAAIRFTDAGTTTNIGATLNSENEIMYASLGSGVLGRATYWFSGSTVVECDLVINADFKWSSATPTPLDSIDVQSVLLHEIGHWLVLRDLYGNIDSGTEYDAAKVMCGIFGLGQSHGSYGFQKRNLHSDDAAGVQYIYGSSGTETVSTPAPPSGPTSGNVNTSYTFTASGALSSIGDPVQYNFDWADGSYSGWLTAGTTSASHSWTVNNTYYLRVKARCALHTSIESAWSSSFTITISLPCSSPSITSQPQNQTITSGFSTTLYVTASGTAPFHYQWYRGTAGDTSNPVGFDSSNFTTPALTVTTSYWVRVTNACGSFNSQTATVQVVPPSSETVSTPSVPTGPASGSVGAIYTFTATGAVSSTGDPVQYNFDWGDGAFSDWLPVGTTTATHSWINSGNFYLRVKARCATHPNIESSWSAMLTLTISQPGSSPIITSQSPDRYISLGGTASLSVVASGSAPLQYQWYQGISGNTARPVGSNASNYQSPALSITTHYWVRVTNTYGGADSQTVTVWVYNSHFDLNQDQIVNDQDVSILADFLAGNIGMLPCGAWCGDLNSDSRVDARDLFALLWFVLGN